MIIIIFEAFRTGCCCCCCCCSIWVLNLTQYWSVDYM